LQCRLGGDPQCRQVEQEVAEQDAQLDEDRALADSGPLDALLDTKADISRESRLPLHSGHFRPEPLLAIRHKASNRSPQSLHRNS